MSSTLKSTLIRIGFIVVIFIAAFFIFRLILPKSESVQIEAKPSDQENREKIANDLFSKFLTTYKGFNIPKRQRLKDFTVREIAIIESNETSFRFTVKYSLRTTVKDSDWHVGSGDPAEKNWINNKFSYVDVELRDKHYVIVSYGTGP